jgi:hypothetical protein
MFTLTSMSQDREVRNYTCDGVEYRLYKIDWREGFTVSHLVDGSWNACRGELAAQLNRQATAEFAAGK